MPKHGSISDTTASVVSLVQYSFTSTETRRLVRTDSPGRPLRLSHSSSTTRVCAFYWCFVVVVAAAVAAVLLLLLFWFSLFVVIPVLLFIALPSTQLDTPLWAKVTGHGMTSVSVYSV